MDLFTYLECQLASFDEEPFNAVDSAVLTQCCMTRIADAAAAPLETDGKETKTAASTSPSASTKRLLEEEPIHFSDLLDTDRFKITVTGPQTGDVERELGLLAASPRYQDLEISNYVEVFEETAHTQFAAMTFTYRQEWAYVGFRGTDGSFAGWRENFDMALEPPVGCQQLAVEHLEAEARRLPCKLYTGGHSKGGNIATYAALRCTKDVQSRIARVYDHDGPGFKTGFIDRTEFDALDGRMHRTVPVDDVVGQIMDTPVPTRAVMSNGRGFEQHSVFAWEVADAMNDFVYEPDLSETSKITHRILDEWLASFSDDELPLVIDAVFETIEASGVTRVGEFFEGSSTIVGLIIEVAKKLEPEKRDMVLPALKSFARIAAKETARGASQATQDAARAAREKLQRRRPFGTNLEEGASKHLVQRSEHVVDTANLEHQNLDIEPSTEEAGIADDESVCDKD